MKFLATIFVEGDADVKFMSDFVKNRFGFILEKGKEIEIVGGKDKLSKFTTRFKISSDQKLTNLLIFDSDDSYENRLRELEAKKDEFRIEFEIFLFPNNFDPGDLETLLEQIINPDNQSIFDCFERFNDCINNITGMNLSPLNRKTKIHNYASVLSDPDLAKERNRDYQEKQHWDLNAEGLTPLFNFLSPYFIQDEN